MWLYKRMCFCLIYKLFVREHWVHRVHFYSHLFTLHCFYLRRTHSISSSMAGFGQLFGAEDIFLFHCGYFSLWILNEWMCSNLIGAMGVGIRWPGYLHLVNNVLIHGVWQPAGSWPWLICLTQQLALYLYHLVMIKLLPKTVWTVPDPKLVTTPNLWDYFRGR